MPSESRNHEECHFPPTRWSKQERQGASQSSTNTAPSDTRTSSAYFSQTCESERAGEGLPASHSLTRWDNAMGHCCAASKQCHIPEEDARAPQNDLTDFTQGQNDPAEPEEQVGSNPTAASHKVGTGKGSSAGQSREEGTHHGWCSGNITLLFFFPWAVSIRRCKLPHLSFYFITLQRCKNQHPEPVLLSEQKSGYRGGFRDKNIKTNCSKGYDKPWYESRPQMQ